MLFFPFSINSVITFLTSVFNLDLSTLSSFESSCLVILCNAYFFGFWFFILYFTLKSLNWVYERLF